MSQRGKLIKKIAFAKRPVREKDEISKYNREVKVKRSRYGVGVALLCCTGLRLPLLQAFATVPRFFIVYNLTAGRVRPKL